MLFRAWAAVLCVAAASPLGAPLVQDGYSIRPPQGFRMGPVDWFRGTRALAVASEPVAARWLSAALVEGAGPAAASMLVARIERPFTVAPASRDELSTAVVRHFSDELGLVFALQSAERIDALPPRVEVLGTVRQGDEARYVLIAAFAGAARHSVVTFSVPSGRWEAMLPAVRASLASYKEEAPAASARERGVAGAVAGALALALVISLVLRYRRDRLTRAARGP